MVSANFFLRFNGTQGESVIKIKNFQNRMSIHRDKEFLVIFRHKNRHFHQCFVKNALKSYLIAQNDKFFFLNIPY